jgi:hypothetical protein
MRLPRSWSRSAHWSRSRHVDPGVHTALPLEGWLQALFVFFLLLGIAFGGIAVRSGSAMRAFVALADRTTGEVVAARSGFGMQNTVPVVEFGAAAGGIYQFTGRMKGMAFHRVGDTVNVLYDPADPTRAEIDFWPELWLGVAVFGLLAVAFVGVTAFVWIVVARS